MSIAHSAGGRQGLLSFLGLSPRHPLALAVEMRTSHGADGNACAKPANNAFGKFFSSALPRARCPPKDATNHSTHSGSGPPQGPHKANTHVEARTKSPRKVLAKRTCTLSWQHSDTAFTPVAKDAERYEHVDSLIALLGDRYGHVDALIELLGDKDAASWFSESEMISAPELIAPPIAGTSHGYLKVESREPATYWCDNAASVYSPADLAVVRKMHAGAGLCGAGRKCEAHAYGWQEASNCSGELMTTLISALEPIDYSRHILRNALLQAGIVE